MVNKYRNKKTTINGHTFDSIKESNRYKELLLLLRAGHIGSITLQEKFELQPSFKINGKTERAIYYIADFSYWDNSTNKRIIEDVKSDITRKNPVYRLKKEVI